LADEIEKYLKCGHTVPLLPPNTNAMVQIDPNKKIGTADAGKFYDETLVVTGKVVEVTVRPSITILGLDVPSPSTPFTAVIFPENAGPFGDLQKLNNQNVEISGIITEYRNRAEIILETTNQIKLVNGK
jgi:DNA/RNA endonuclease YhcR with UshA esterase domain